MAAYYYAQIDSNNIVIAVSQLSGEVTDAHMISIQSLDRSLLGEQYDSTNKTFNAVPPPVPTLDQAKTAKIAELRQDYANTLAAGFQATVSGTSYTFGAADSDITHMNAIQKAIEKGYESFPVDYGDANGSPVSIPDQTTLDAIEKNMTTFVMSNYKNLQSLIGQVQTAYQNGDMAGIQAVSWT